MTVPNEGETLILNMVLARVLTDRDATLECGLYTNSGLTLETATESALTEPSGGGYARIDLTDGSWSISGDEGTYSAVDFTASSTDMTGIYGAFICTKSSGGTARLISIIAHPDAPVTVPVGQTLRVDLTATAA